MKLATIIGYLCVLPFTERKIQANNNVINHCKSEYLQLDVKDRVFFSIYRAKHLAESFARSGPE